jgi:anti-sigma factor RsiW
MMNVTRDVVRDLLTVYLAGDASADTRALVEEYLASDPGLKAEADGAAAGLVPLPPTPPSPPSAERKALAKTRELMRTRTSTLVTAVVFTALPFTFTFSGGRITFVLFRDEPVIAAAWWATAAVLWGWHIWVRRRLTVSGI